MFIYFFAKSEITTLVAYFSFFLFSLISFYKVTEMSYKKKQKKNYYTKQMRCDVFIGKLQKCYLVNFVTFGQSQASLFFLFAKLS